MSFKISSIFVKKHFVVYCVYTDCMYYVLNVVLLGNHIAYLRNQLCGRRDCKLNNFYEFDPPTYFLNLSGVIQK